MPVKTDLIKKPNIEQEYTRDYILELERCMDDPQYFIENYCMLTQQDGSKGLFKLYSYQEDILKNYQGHDLNIVMLARQLGKTVLAAAYCLWWCMFKDNQIVIVASNKGSNAQSIMRRFKDMYFDLPLWLKAGVTVNNVMSMHFDNGTIIQAETTTESTGRGSTPSLVYLDEFAFVPINVQKEFWASIQPALSQGGRLIMTSTPDTDEDEFARIWYSADDADNSMKWVNKHIGNDQINDELIEDDYETVFEVEGTEDDEQYLLTDEDDDTAGFVRYFAHWSVHPNRDEKFKRRMLAGGMEPSVWNREFECIFSGAQGSLISSSALIRSSAYVRLPRFVDKYGVRWFDFIEPNKAYAVTIDPSEGCGKDNAVIQVWSLPDLRQVAEWADNATVQVDQAKMIARVLRRIEYEQQADPDHMGQSRIYYSIECNGVGAGVLNLVVENEYDLPGYLVDSENNSSRGLRTTEPSKRQYSLLFKSLIESGKFAPFSSGLASELKSFIKVGKSYKAKPGTKDDRVMSCVLMCQLIEELKFMEEGIDEALSHDLLEEHDFDVDQPLPDIMVM